MQDLSVDFSTADDSAEVFSLRFDHEDKFLAVSYSDGQIKIFNSVNGKVVYRLHNTLGHIEETKMPVTAMRWRPNISSLGNLKDVLLTVTSDGRIIYWHAPT